MPKQGYSSGTTLGNAVHSYAEDFATSIKTYVPIPWAVDWFPPPPQRNSHAMPPFPMELAVTYLINECSQHATVWQAACQVTQGIQIGARNLGVTSCQPPNWRYGPWKSML